MDLSNIVDMKYHDLIQYAKNLGIEFHNSKPKKDTIIASIKKHLTSNVTNHENENNDENNGVEKKKKKVKKIIKVVKKSKKSSQQEIQDENEQSEEANEEEKKQALLQVDLNRTMTRSKLKLNKTLNNKNDIESEIKQHKPKQEEDIEQDDSKPKKRVKKIKKVKSKDQETNDENQIEQQEQVTEKEVKKVRKVKKVKKIELNEQVEDNRETTIKKVKRVKKINKKSIESNPEEQEEPVKADFNNINEEESKHVEEDDQNDNQDFRLELDDEEDENLNPKEEKIEEPKQTETINLDETKEQENNFNNEKIKNKNEINISNSSLITNDEDNSNLNDKQNEFVEKNQPNNEKGDETLNITRDIANSTFDKSSPIKLIKTDENQQILSCTSFYSQKPAIHQNDEASLKEKHEELETQDKPSLEEKKDEEQNLKPKTGGARIVRPKQVVNVVQSVKNIRDEIVAQEVTQKVVEVVKREAGPRIVKPIITEDTNNNDPKRRLNDTNASKIKKLKDNPIVVNKKQNETNSNQFIPKKAAPAPDFRSIHEKEAQKMESIDSYEKRKQERHVRLIEKSPLIETNSKQEDNIEQSKQILKQKIKTPSSSTITKPIINKTGKTPIKQSLTNTPKLAKTIVSQASSLLSNIPRFLQKKSEDKNEIKPVDKQENESIEKPIENQSNEPKTPELNKNLESKLKLHKTPSSVTKPTESFLLKSNIKRNPSIKQNDQNQIPPQLQSSSFVRRKSYDLSKSLSKPLGYNPHIGKLKPVDFNTKSVFLASLATTGSNLNETKIADNSVLKQITNHNESICSNANNDASKRRISSIKASGFRSNSENSSAGNRNILTDYIKSENLKKINDKSTQIAKKLRMEKAKMHKQAVSDQNRKLANLSRDDENIDSNENEINADNHVKINS